jgi:hypothetical protein
MVTGQVVYDLLIIKKVKNMVKEVSSLIGKIAKEFNLSRSVTETHYKHKEGLKKFPAETFNKLSEEKANEFRDYLKTTLATKKVEVIEIKKEDVQGVAIENSVGKVVAKIDLSKVNEKSPLGVSLQNAKKNSAKNAFSKFATA